MSETATSRQHRNALGLCFLLALALAGGAVGLWVMRSIRQHRTVEMIAASGDPVAIFYGYQLDADLEVDYSAAPPGPAWLRDRLGIDYLDSVEFVLFLGPPKDHLLLLKDLPDLRALHMSSGHDVNDQTIEELGALPRLERLVLGSSPITEHGVKVLCGLPHLRSLMLSDCPQIDDRALEPLSQCGNLTSLAITDYEKVTTAGLSRLSRLTNLRELVVSFEGSATDAALEELGSLSHLRDLSLRYRSGGSAGGLRYLDRLTSLEELGLMGGEGISDASLDDLPVLPKLERLVIVFPREITATGLKNLTKLPNLRTLVLNALPLLDDAAIEHISGLAHLEELNVYGEISQLTDASLASLGRMTSLRRLQLCRCPSLTDAGLKHLEKLHGLARLQLEPAAAEQFSPEALTALRTALPRCVVKIETPEVGATSW